MRNGDSTRIYLIIKRRGKWIAKQLTFTHQVGIIIKLSCGDGDSCEVWFLSKVRCGRTSGNLTLSLIRHNIDSSVDLFFLSEEERER